MFKTPEQQKALLELLEHQQRIGALTQQTVEILDRSYGDYGHWWGGTYRRVDPDTDQRAEFWYRRVRYFTPSGKESKRRYTEYVHIWADNGIPYAIEVERLKIDTGESHTEQRQVYPCEDYFDEDFDGE